MQGSVALAILISLSSLQAKAQMRNALVGWDSTDCRPLGLARKSFDRKAPGLQPLQLQPPADAPQGIKADMASRQLPFFCRQELKMEKESGLRLRVRLGSVQQSDWLEQKPGAVSPH